MKIHTIFDISLNKEIIISKKKNKILYNTLENLWFHTGEIKYYINNIINPNISNTDFLFIHIPKTGGISFKLNVLHNPQYNLIHKISIYHIITLGNDKMFDIFQNDFKLFSIIRNPTKIIFSCYYYFKHLMLKNNINISIEQFIESYKNIQIKFLLGYCIFSNYEVTKKDYNKIINLINIKKLTIGVYEKNYMNNIYSMLNIHNHVDMYILNKNNNDYNKDAIENDSYIKKIIEYNNYDFMLYNYITK